ISRGFVAIDYGIEVDMDTQSSSFLGSNTTCLVSEFRIRCGAHRHCPWKASRPDVSESDSTFEVSSYPQRHPGKFLQVINEQGDSRRLMKIVYFPEHVITAYMKP